MAAFNSHEIARVCHEANRAVQQVLGEPENPPWEYLSADLRESTLKGVEAALAGAGPEALHASWCEERIAGGWVYGETKDPEAKTHPCLVRYSELPAEQRVKDHVFGAVVAAMSRSDL